MFGAQAGIELPQFPVPIPQLRPITNMNLNNIRIDNSSIGILNSGNIQSIDQSVTMLDRSGESDVAIALAKLTEAVANDPGGNSVLKNQIVDILSTVGGEAEKPKEQRKIGTVRAAINELATLFGGLAGLSQLWETYAPTLRSFFGI